MLIGAHCVLLDGNCLIIGELGAINIPKCLKNFSFGLIEIAILWIDAQSLFDRESGFFVLPQRSKPLCQEGVGEGFPVAKGKGLSEDLHPFFSVCISHQGCPKQSYTCCVFGMILQDLSNDLDCLTIASA